MKSFRIYHLLLGILALAAYLSAEELGIVHAWLGYAVAAMIVARLALGLARSRGFELRRLVPSVAPGPLGATGIRHPAISRILILAILASVAGAAATGIALDRGGTLAGQGIRHDDFERERHEEVGDDREGSARPGQSDEVHARDRDLHDSDDDEGGLLAEIHEALGSLVLPLVLAHVVYLLLFRFELARFMLFAERRQS